MVKRRTGMKPGFKKCLITKLRGSKIKTAKQARKAFSAASKKCRKLGTAKKVKGKKCKYGHRKNSTKCLKKPRGKKAAKGRKIKCKFGRNKKTHRCLKHKRS
jgi:hypothetical protein